jgi:hypothetical protein
MRAGWRSPDKAGGYTLSWGDDVCERSATTWRDMGSGTRATADHREGMCFGRGHHAAIYAIVPVCAKIVA